MPNNMSPWLIVMRGKRKRCTVGADPWLTALLQLSSHPLLMPPPNREHHAPVAAQKIGLPRPAAFGFEQRFVSLAKGPQAFIARDHNSFPAPRSSGGDCARRLDG